MRSVTLNNGAEFVSNGRKITSLMHTEGEAGIVTLSDGSILQADTVSSDEVPFQLRTNGGFETNVRIVENKHEDNPENIVAKYEGEDGYFYATTTSLITTWMLSKNKIKNNSACIYLDSDNGSDEYDGSLENPVKTLDKAYDLINSERKTIVLKTDYTVDAMPETALPDGVESVKICANDGDNDYRLSARLVIGTSISLHSNTVFDDLIITRPESLAESTPGYIYACGYRFEVGENVTLQAPSSWNSTYVNIHVYANGSGHAVDTVDLELSSGAWAGVYIDNRNYPVGTDNGYGRDNINEETIAKIVLNKDLTTLGINTDIYGGLEIEINGKGNYSSTQFLFSNKNFYGPVKIKYTGNCSSGASYQDIICGNFYGKVTVDISECDSNYYYYETNIYGNFYAGADIDLGSGYNPSGGPANFYIGMDSELTKRVNGSGSSSAVASKVCIYDTFTVHTSSIVGSNKWIGIGSDVNFYENGEIIINEDELFDVYNRASDISKVTVNLNNLTEENKNYKFRTLSGIGHLNIADNLSVSYSDETDWEGVSVSLGENSEFRVNGSMTLGSEENNSGLLNLGNSSRLVVNGLLNVYGNATAPAKDNIAVVTLIGAKSGVNRISGDVTGWAQLDSSENGMIMLLPNFVGTLSDDKMSYTRDNSGFTATDISGLTFENTVHDGVNALELLPPDRRVIYVDADNGDDIKSSGVSPDSPVKTLNRAYTLLASGGTIVLMNDITVSAWPTGAVKKAHITGYDERNKTFYNSKLSVSSEINLHAETYFECLEANFKGRLVAEGYPVTFGVPKEKFAEYIEECPDVLNFRSNAFQVYGTGIDYKFPTSITIHSGTFQNVDPWTPDYRDKAGEDGKVVSTVVMTGGTIKSGLGRGSYTSPRGIVKYILSGGSSASLGANYVIDYSRGTIYEEYDISGSFTFNNYTSGSSGSNPGNFTFNIHDMDEGVVLGTFNCGNAGNISKTVNQNFTFNISNATIARIQSSGGITSTGNDLLNTITLNLGKGANIQEIYAGSKGVSETAKSLVININDASASIGAFYDHGYSTFNSIADTQIHVNCNASKTIDFLQGKIAKLYSENGSTVIMTAEALDDIEYIEIEGGSAIYLPRGTQTDAAWQASADKDNPSTVYAPNASNLKLMGEINGFSKVKAAYLADGVLTVNTNGFINGLNIYTTGANSDKGECFFTESPDPEFAFVETDDGYKWQLGDGENTLTRNKVYVGLDLQGENGNDSSEGTAAAPVLTLSKAYQKSAQRYQALVEGMNALAAKENLTEEEIALLEGYKTSLVEGMSIIVSGTVGLGDFGDAELKTAVENAKTLESDYRLHVTVKSGENGGVIQFIESNAKLPVPYSTTFSSLTLNSTCINTPPVISAGGNKVTVSADVKTTGTHQFEIYGGSDENVQSTELTVHGGKWGSIYGGGRTGAVEKTVLVLDENAKAQNVYGGGRLTSAKTTEVSLTVNGGSFTSIYGGGFNAFTGNIKVAVNGGTVENLYGGGYENTANADNISVVIGSGSNTETAAVTKLYRGVVCAADAPKLRLPK